METWIITDGKIGTEKQCLALAELIGVKAKVKTISAKFPWSFLPPAFWVNPLAALDEKSQEQLKEPWPDLIIAASRLAAAPVAFLKKMLGKKITTIFMQNPYINLNAFDVVIAPRHDGLSGKNLISIQGALHNVTPAILKKEGAKWSRILPKDFPRPWVSILLGGNSRHHTMDLDTMEYYGAQLRHLAQRTPMSFFITASRRTPPEAVQAFKTALGDSHVFLWNGLGENPYYGFLALGDFILVTNDSVSMLSEAASAGKPLYSLALEGGSRRLDKFYESLIEQGICRPFAGELESWENKAIDSREDILQQLRKKIKISA
jgi:uncharacterized protein